ncbi:MAG: DNA repair protein RadC [Fimbriimonadales bacterium]
MQAGKDDLVERVRKSGLKAASPVDLIAIVFSRRRGDAEGSEFSAKEMLKRFGSIGKVADASFEDIQDATGLEEYEILRCLALIELGRRAGRAEKGLHPEVEVAEDVYALLDHLKYEKQEHFVVVLLDAKQKVMRVETVHIGTLSMSPVGPREVFRIAIREGASSIIVAHNHPSGDPTPSPEDLEVTKRLVEVGKLLDIPVIDHVIIGDPGSVSFQRKGLL